MPKVGYRAGCTVARRRRRESLDDRRTVLPLMDNGHPWRWQRQQVRDLQYRPQVKSRGKPTIRDVIHATGTITNAADFFLPLLRYEWNAVGCEVRSTAPP